MRKSLLLILAVITPAITPGETLHGAVKDSLDTPIFGAFVFIHWDSAGSTVGLKDNIGVKADLSIRTKDDGTFSVDLPPGFYDVFAAVPAFTPMARKVRIKQGAAVDTTFRMNADPLYTAEMGNRVEALNGFSGVTPGYVPEATAMPRPGVGTVEQCESACSSSLTCKAYAFDTVKFACYFYSEVFMGGTPETRRLGMYSSGLSVLPKTGFISAFKRSSFPPLPVPVQRPK